MVSVYCGRCQVWIGDYATAPGAVTVAHLEVTEGGARLYGTRAHREPSEDLQQNLRRHSPTTVLATSGRTPVPLRCSACGPLGTVSARTLAARWRAGGYDLLTWPNS